MIKIMKKAMGISTLAAVAAISTTTLMATPAQAFVIGSSVTLRGTTTFSKASNLLPNTEVITFNTPTLSAASGSFSGVTAEIQSIESTLISGTSVFGFLGIGQYSYVPQGGANNPWITFSNSSEAFTFHFDPNQTLGRVNLLGNPLIGFTGSGKFFNSQGNLLARGTFEGLGSGLVGSEYTIDIQTEAVPEPLTIIGSGLALGFGAMFKKQRSKKEKAPQDFGA